MKKLLILFALFGFFPFGCGPSQVELTQACSDYVTALARLDVRCKGQKLETAMKNYTDNRFCGSCDKTTAVRDMNALKSTCIPNLNASTCDENDMSNAKTAEACLRQISCE